MTPEEIARIAANAERAKAKTASLREQMRAKYPELAVFIRELRERGMLLAVTVDGVRYGKPPLDRPVPKIPGR